MLTFESSSVLGATPITEKLSSLPFEKVKHQVSTLDSQPTVEGGIIILITGQLLVRVQAFADSTNHLYTKTDVTLLGFYLGG